MGVSLSVYKLKNTNKENLMNNVASESQKTFADLDLIDEIAPAKSYLKFYSYNEEEEIVIYKATHYSENKSNPIRIFLDNIEDSFSGIEPELIPKLKKGTKRVEIYQEIYYFDVIINFKTEEIFVLTKKTVANAFMKRFKKKINYTKIYFDLSKVDDIPELSNIWGAWENSEGRCKRKAYFGTEIQKYEGIEKKKVTSYNVEFELDKDKVVDLFIAMECRLSSTSGIMTNDYLIDIYKTLSTNLTISENLDDFIEAFEEVEE